MSLRVLVVDDEKLIVKGIKFSLEQDGMEVDTAYDGEEALQKASKINYGLILLDIMLPKLNGFEVCKKIRQFSAVPIIMLTAKGEDEDIIAGLEDGADDYIRKPFNINEVKARINVIIRRVDHRVSKNDVNIFKTGDLLLDIDGKRCFIAEKEINLTVKEFELLLLLTQNPNKVYSRAKLLYAIWGEEYPGDVRTVDVHIRRLREKVEKDPSEPKYVHTKWGVGYFYE